MRSAAYMRSQKSLEIQPAPILQAGETEIDATFTPLDLPPRTLPCCTRCFQECSWPRALHHRGMQEQSPEEDMTRMEACSSPEVSQQAK